MTYFCYILYSERKNRFYVGSCSNLEDRIKKHNTNHKGFTGKTGDWLLKYKEVFDSLREARQRELEIKKVEKSKVD